MKRPCKFYLLRNEGLAFTMVMFLARPTPLVSTWPAFFSPQAGWGLTARVTHTKRHEETLCQKIISLT
jgi:hypothetical protein